MPIPLEGRQHADAEVCDYKPDNDQADHQPAGKRRDHPDQRREVSRFECGAAVQARARRDQDVVESSGGTAPCLRLRVSVTRGIQHFLNLGLLGACVRSEAGG